MYVLRSTDQSMQPSTERKPDWAWDAVSIVDNNEKSNNYCQHVLRTCDELDTESRALHRLPHSIFPVILWDRSVSSLDPGKQDSCPSPVPLGYFQSSAVNVGLTRSSKELQHSCLWGFPGAPQIGIKSSRVAGQVDHSCQSRGIRLTGFCEIGWLQWHWHVDFWWLKLFI